MWPLWVLSGSKWSYHTHHVNQQAGSPKYKHHVTDWDNTPHAPGEYITLRYHHQAVEQYEFPNHIYPWLDYGIEERYPQWLQILPGQETGWEDLMEVNPRAGRSLRMWWDNHLLLDRRSSWTKCCGGCLRCLRAIGLLEVCGINNFELNILCTCFMIFTFYHFTSTYERLEACKMKVRISVALQFMSYYSSSTQYRQHIVVRLG